MCQQQSNEQQAQAFDAIKALIEEARTIAICAHTNPDGDALGSELALAQIIGQLWPDKQVATLLADDAPSPAMYAFLEGADGLAAASAYELDPDLFICVDLSSPSRLKNAEPVMLRSKRVAVIDHHPASEEFWDAGIVRTDAAAAGVIVTEFAQHLGATITPSMAQALFSAVVTDTGRFQYQNSDGESFRIAADLVEAGADPSDIALKVYQSDRLAYLHLEAKVMGRTTTLMGGRIAYGYATQAEIEALGVEQSECEGLVDAVRRVAGAQIVVFLKEQGDGIVRGSLRAKGDADVSTVAREMGGGGHKAAAGFTSEGDVDTVLSAILPKLHALLGEEGEGVR